MHRELLAARGGAAGEQGGLALAAMVFNHLKDRFVIQLSVIIMHFQRAASIKIADILHRNALAEIGFETVHPHIQQFLKVGLIPPNRLGIGEIHDRQAGLP